MPENGSLNWKGIAADRTVLPDVAERLLFQLRDAGKTPALGHAPLPVTGKERPVLSGPDGELLIRIIHQKPVPVEQVIQHLLPETFYTGLKGQLGILPADIHRVILDAAGLTDILISAVFTDKAVFPEQPLPKQDKLPGPVR